MFKHSLTVLMATTALSAGAPASATPVYEPIYITDGQYTATLLQHSSTAGTHAREFNK